MGLTGENLKYAAENIKECRKHGYNKRRVLIVTGSDKKGRNLAAILQTAYNATGIADYSGGYKDFSLCFDTMWRRDEVVQQINEAISKYRAEHSEIYNPPQQTEPPISGENPDPAATETPDTPEKESPDWTTYIIIGLAAVAIVLLVWPKKKK